MKIPPLLQHRQTVGWLLRSDHTMNLHSGNFLCSGTAATEPLSGNIIVSVYLFTTHPTDARTISEAVVVAINNLSAHPYGHTILFQ